MENTEPKELTARRELRDKWIKVYTETLEKYPNLKAWLDFKRTDFERLMSFYISPDIPSDGVKRIENYIVEVVGMVESINTQIAENIDRFEEFIKDISPRFVTVDAIRGVGMPEREYPYLYYATDFTVEELDSEYHEEGLKFYGTDGLRNGFIPVIVFPTWQVIRNMTREEFDKFLGQKLSSVNLTPWDFDEYKKKWIKLYEDTTEPQAKNNKISKGVHGEYGIIEHFHETKE